MRVQTSVTLVSLLIASVTIGLHQSEYRLSGLQTVNHSRSPVNAHQPDSYLCHRGSGRLENNLNSVGKRNVNLVAITTNA